MAWVLRSYHGEQLLPPTLSSPGHPPGDEARAVVVQAATGSLLELTPRLTQLARSNPLLS